MVYVSFILSTISSNALKQKYFIHQTVQQVTLNLAYHLLSTLSFNCTLTSPYWMLITFCRCLTMALGAQLQALIFSLYNYMDQTLPLRLPLASILHMCDFTFIAGNVEEKKKFFFFKGAFMREQCGSLVEISFS